MTKPHTSDFFFDAHCHLFNFNNISLSSLLERYTKSMKIGDLKTLFEVLAITKIDRIINLFRTYELEIEHIIEHMYQSLMNVPDLKNKIKIILPLIMDFEAVNPDEKLSDQVKYLKGGIKKYFRKHKTGGFYVFPFLGIDPARFTSPARLEKFLHTSFHELLTRRTLKNGDFIGVKVYPPLGFDPTPDGKELVSVLFDFCVENEIPVTSHCSDLGFNADTAFLKKTDPARWRAVLEDKRWHDLRLNLAHAGGKIESRHARGWSNTIFDLMNAYPNVYADLSFIADDKHEMKKLYKTLKGAAGGLSGKILFGTDFSIVLLKTDGLEQYLADAIRNLTVAGFTEYSSVNVARFLGPKIVGKLPFKYPLYPGCISSNKKELVKSTSFL